MHKGTDISSIFVSPLYSRDGAINIFYLLENFVELMG